MKITISRIGPNESLIEHGDDEQIAVSVTFTDTAERNSAGSAAVEIFLPRREIRDLPLAEIHGRAIQEARRFLEQVLAHQLH